MEGECEEKLIKALKEKPSLLIPGKVKRFDVIQNELKTSHLVTFAPGSLSACCLDFHDAMLYNTSEKKPSNQMQLGIINCIGRCGSEKVSSESYHNPSRSIDELELTKSMIPLKDHAFSHKWTT